MTTAFPSVWDTAAAWATVHEAQTQSNWCWAACVRMVTAYRMLQFKNPNDPGSQCAVANVAHATSPFPTFQNIKDCCDQPGMCNYVRFDDQTTKLLDDGAVAVKHTYANNPLSEVELVQAASGASIAMLGLNAVEGTGGHLVLVGAVWTPDPAWAWLGTWYLCLDPSSGEPRWYTFDHLVSGLSGGFYKWTTTFTMEVS